MKIRLASRLSAVKPSPTLAVAAKAAQLRAQGEDVIGLGTGEPDFDTPEHIKQAAISAINAGATKYTPVDGTPELKHAVIEKFRRDNGLEYTPEQILISCGGKQSFYNLCQALLDEGDEVIIPAPYWVSYPDMVHLAGGRPVIVHTTLEQKLKMTPQQLEAAITPKTRLVVINSPSNPTGVAYSAAELSALAEVLRQYPDILVATDDMYEHILWSDAPFHNILNVASDLYERTIVLNGVSKAYAMTGWRIGYAGGPRELIQAMKKVQSQSTSNPAAPSQAAAVAALNGDQSCVRQMVDAFKRRHDYLFQRLSAMPGIECLPSDGTFYSFPSVQKIIDALKGIKNDVQFAEYLLETVGLALVPGSAFGAPGHVRLSFATDDKTLAHAADRLERVAIQALKSSK